MYRAETNIKYCHLEFRHKDSKVADTFTYKKYTETLEQPSNVHRYIQVTHKQPIIKTVGEQQGSYLSSVVFIVVLDSSDYSDNDCSLGYIDKNNF